MKNMDKFIDDLQKLREKYPMCYIEAWTPIDFQTKWNSAKSANIADALYENFDANYGTNWDSIEDAKNKL